MESYVVCRDPVSCPKELLHLKAVSSSEVDLPKLGDRNLMEPMN